MYLEGGSTSLIMSGGEIFGNTAKGKRNACAGLWIYNGASFTMTGGRIYNNDNESWGGSSLGGAIHFRGGGTFSISGSASIPSGVSGTTGPGKNDVYLYGTSKITITDDLTAATPIATITPAGYPGEGSIVSRQVLDGSEDLLSDNYDKFAVTPQSDGTVWLTNSTGYLRKETLTAADFTSASLIESYKDLMTIDGSSFYADSLADMEGKTLLLWTNYDYYEAGASVNADVYVAVTFSQINGTSFIMTFRAYKNDSSIANINIDYDLGDYETNDDFFINETGYLSYDDVGGEGIIYIGNDAPYAVSTGLGGDPGESGYYLIE